MKKQTHLRPLILLLLPLLAVMLVMQVQAQPTPDSFTILGGDQHYTETIPVIDLQAYGYQPVALPTQAASDDSPFTVPSSPVNGGGGSDPNNPFAVIRQTGPTFIQPGAVAQYEITLANYESITHTYQLVDTLPPGLTYLPDSAAAPELVPGALRHSAQAAGLDYNAATRTLSWQGELPPGNLEYIIETSSPSLPYLDLSEFGIANLCDGFIANGQACDDVSVTFNLGVNGYTTSLYGQTISQLTVSVNGLVLAADTAVTNSYAHNQLLPDGATPGVILAGLWRDVAMGGGEAPSNGRYHAAIIRGLVEEHDVFYAQWHDAPSASDPGAAGPGTSARHAVAIVLDSAASTGSAPASTGSAQTGAGQIFFIYDNIADPAQLVAQGYTIGIGDKLGARGVTYAYAPCCGDVHLPQGFPPAAGTTLQLRPVLFGAANGYSRTFSYEAVVTAPVPETIVNTAVVTSSSFDPALAYAWSTHYLYVRRQLFLPLTIGGGE